VRAYNDGLSALAHGVHCTATSAMATWGLPPPETSPSSDVAAPQCWHQASVAAAAQELLRAQVSSRRGKGGWEACVCLRTGVCVRVHVCVSVCWVYRCGRLGIRGVLIKVVQYHACNSA
jgi:hypothetical protein